MEKRIARLESFNARGSDGNTYTVNAYEHQCRVGMFNTDPEHWEPTGLAEYKLSDGRHVDLDANGRLVVSGTSLTLERETAPRPAS
ncbi:hypothetical protein [Rhizobacter sp. LjRoot28]|uniref:hypothetical protein n=1 Tax=Rhizobacter sp. LjRoot28 TaxID=3342309 RepID=UPI003ECCAF02